MLIQFSVANFRSIKKRQTFSFVASSSLKEDPGSTIQVDDGLYLVRVAAIYGANASGKSNVLKALNWLLSAVVHSQRSWEPNGAVPVEPFLLDRSSAKADSEFEIDFVVAKRRYRYGLLANRHRVEREWLYAYPRGRKQVWLERTRQIFSFGKHLTGENKAIEKLTRPNSLFLSAAAQNNHAQLFPLHEWLARSEIRVVLPESHKARIRQTISFLARNPVVKASLVDFLAKADLGVEDIVLTKRNFVPEATELTRAVAETLEVNFGKNELAEAANEASLDIALAHRAAGRRSIQIPFTAESEGTTNLLAFALDVLSALSLGRIVCIDELAASLHPHIAAHIVELFADPASNPKGAQLLFTTHGVELLTRKLLRRDGIWFTEKDEFGATSLYPLSDFTVRKDEILASGYLQGRYGAVPFIESPTAASNGK
jgi:AAA15 family ATPase/GTPase